MEFNIKVYQNDEGIFAEVFLENKSICIGDGESPYKAVQDVCSVLSDIMQIMERQENKEIIELIEKREKQDNETTYSLDEILQFKKEKEYMMKNLKIIK